MPSASADHSAALAVSAARRELVGLSTQLLDVQADAGDPLTQAALDAAVERLSGRLLDIADDLPTPQRDAL